MFWMLMGETSDLPSPSGPFPEPDRQQIGDFYVRLGMTIAAWQFVESSLIMIYASAVRATQYNALASSFHTPTNFRVRLDMTNEAVLHCGLDTDLTTEWGKIYEKAKTKAKRRNQLAHAIVLFDPKRTNAQNQLFLVPHLLDPAKSPQDFGQGNVITQPELDAMLASFERLHEILMQFQRKMPVYQM